MLVLSRLTYKERLHSATLFVHGTWGLLTPFAVLSGSGINPPCPKGAKAHPFQVYQHALSLYLFPAKE